MNKKADKWTAKKIKEIIIKAFIVLTGVSEITAIILGII